MFLVYEKYGKSLNELGLIQAWILQIPGIVGLYFFTKDGFNSTIGERVVIKYLFKLLITWATVNLVIGTDFPGLGMFGTLYLSLPFSIMLLYVQLILDEGLLPIPFTTAIIVFRENVGGVNIVCGYRNGGLGKFTRIDSEKQLPPHLLQDYHTGFYDLHTDQYAIIEIIVKRGLLDKTISVKHKEYG